MVWIILFAGAVILIAILLSGADATKTREASLAIQTNLHLDPEFSATSTFLGLKERYRLQIDEQTEKIRLVTPNGVQVADFKSIVDVEIIDNGESVFKKSLTRTIGGAVIGGVLTGGIGAIVGGLSGGSKEIRYVSKVQVKILLRSLEVSSIIIDCFDSKTMTIEGRSSVKSNGNESYLYKQGLDDAVKIKDLISIIIDKTKLIDRGSISSIEPTKSVVDELSKLADLYERGLLDEQEFYNLKKKLLLTSNSRPIDGPQQILPPKPAPFSVLDSEVKSLLARGEYIEAVSYVNIKTGLDLAESKSYVDKLKYSG